MENGEEETDQYPIWGESVFSRPRKKYNSTSRARPNVRGGIGVKDVHPAKDAETQAEVERGSREPGKSRRR